MRPKQVSEFTGIRKERLPHETRVYIEQPIVPSEGRGHGARYSVMDALLIKLGKKIGLLGLGNHHRRQIIRYIDRNLRDYFMKKYEGQYAPDKYLLCVVEGAPVHLEIYVLEARDIRESILDDTIDINIVINLSNFLDRECKKLRQILEKDND